MIEICLCTYNRNEYLPSLIDQLNKQTYGNFRLNIWNNNFRDIFDLVRHFPQNRLLLIQSDYNAGSQARFRLIPFIKGNPIIFIDDDLILESDFVEYYYEQYLKYGKKTILGWFTKIFNKEDYWNSNHSDINEEEIDYIGTGGMIIDRYIFEKEQILQLLPPEFKDVEDLYLCYIARECYGMKLIKIKPKCSYVRDNKDQWRRLIQYKSSAFKLLREKGWKLLKDK